MKFEDKLAQSEQLLRLIFEGTLDAMLLVDGTGRYVEANPAACELYGLPREQLIGKRIEHFTSPSFDAASARQRFLQADELRGELQLVRPDGTRREVEFNSRANIVPGMHLTVLRDITERKRTENALRQSRYLLE
jgi:PAS domain S-box-containing protein